MKNMVSFQHNAIAAVFAAFLHFYSSSLWIDRLSRWVSGISRTTQVGRAVAEIGVLAPNQMGAATVVSRTDSMSGQ
jgi:hypothetical protein